MRRDFSTLFDRLWAKQDVETRYLFVGPQTSLNIRGPNRIHIRLQQGRYIAGQTAGVKIWRERPKQRPKLGEGHFAALGERASYIECHRRGANSTLSPQEGRQRASLAGLRNQMRTLQLHRT